MLIIFLKILIALPFILMGLVIISVIYASFSHKKQMKKLYETLCPGCSKPIGKEAVEIARDNFSRKMEEFRKNNPGTRLRISPQWNIICPHCNASLIYDVSSNNLRKEAEPTGSDQSDQAVPQ